MMGTVSLIFSFAHSVSASSIHFSFTLSNSNTLMRLKNYLSRCKQWEISLAYYDENLDCLDNLKETIRMQIRNGRIDDNASKDLKSFRDEIRLDAFSNPI